MDNFKELGLKEMKETEGGLALFKINWNLVGKWGLAGAAAYCAFA